MNPNRLRDWLIRSIAGTCGVEPSEVDVDRPLRDYGLTSRESLQLTGELEDLLDLVVPTNLLWQHPTITDLVSALLDQPDAEKHPTTTAETTSGPTAAAEPIAVIGIGCRMPGGVRGPDDFWRLLMAGGTGITEVPDGRWEQFGPGTADHAERLSQTTRFGGFLDDIGLFDADFFGISPREARTMDPQQRLLLEVAWEALEHAGLAPDRLRGSATGVFVGISGNEYSHLTLDDASRVDAWSVTGSALSVAANRLSYLLDLRGPSVAVDSACSSSLVAVHLAVQSLRSGESGIALAAGANLLLGPGITAGFDQMGVTAPDGRCKTFDAAANGIARAEGVGVVVLKPLRAAVRDGDRVLAVLRGSAVNSDGRSNGLTAPNPQAQRAVLRTAYAAAGIDPAEVDYVEAHGTGTELGDPIEASALGAVLGAGRPADRPLVIGSVKTNIGHLEAAAGIAGLIKVVLALANRRIPASLHFTELSPHIAFEDLRLEVAADQRPWPDRGRPARAGVSGFGFGGTNAHVVVEQAPPAVPATGGLDRPGQFVLAAPSETRLRRAADRLADWLTDADEHVDLADVEHTTARRASGRSRAVVTARTSEELVAGLRAVARAHDTTPGVAIGTRDRLGPGPVWVFSGLGSQWAGMGRLLLAAEPAFAEAVHEIDELMFAESGISLRKALDSGAEVETFSELQPVVFGLQVALARLWEHYGVRPAAVIGHSLGEVAAAVVAGAIPLADGVRIAVRRARLLADTAGVGAMAVLELGAAEISALLADYPDVDLAVFNSPSQTVVAGPVDQVHALVEVVERRGLLARLVKSTVAGHCALVEDVSVALRAELPDLDSRPPAVRVYPTAAEGPVAFDADYWVANVRQPVRFTQAVATALADGFSTFVEISPHPVLLHAITETAAAQDVDVTVLGTLRRTDDEVWQFHANLGALLAIDDTPRPTAGALLDLPTTAWEDTEHWVAPVGSSVPANAHPLLGAHIETPESRTHLWHNDLGTLSQPWLADHRIGGRPVLAGACYVEMAYAAASTALGCAPERLVLTGLTLYQPLPLVERTPVTTTFEAEESGGQLRVHTKTPRGDWTLHCDVTVTQASAEPPTHQAGQEYGDRLTSAELYERLRTLGIDYGPAFSGVVEVHAGDGIAVATVGVPEAAPRGGYLVHPALLDSCLQAFVTALSTSDDPDVLYIPMEFGVVRLLGDPRRGVRAHVRVDGLVGELRLVDEDERVLVEILDVFVRQVKRAELAAPLREELLEREWRQVDLPAGREPGQVLLVADGANPLVGPVLGAFAAAGVSTRVVSEVDPTALAGHQPSVVALLVDRDESDGLESGERALFAGVEWVRALAGLPGTPPRLWLVTADAATVLPGETGQPGPAALRGLVRVLSYEHPGIRASWLDLDGTDPLRAAEEAVDEMTAGSRDDEVAWRGGHRYVARLTPAPPPEPANRPVVRPCGGYVVTGGLGGLGLLLARWLAERGASRIVLNGRSAPTPAAAAVIEDLCRAGTSVEVVLGDIAEPGVAEKLLALAWNPRGVVHAAAVFDDRTVARLDEPTLHASWLPKAHGAWRLHEASADLDLDWWLGFSSATGLHGLPGQPAYASANAYLDAVVALRQAKGLPATTINWGLWAEVGAAAGVDVPWLRPILPTEGLDLIADVLASGPTAVGALRLNTRRLAADFPDLLSVPFFSELLRDERAEPTSTDWPGMAAVLGGEPSEVRRLAGTQLRARIASILGLRTDSLVDDRPLTGLGVDSLLAVRIRNALEHDFGINLPVSVLLRGATTKDLCDRVFTELGVVANGRQARPGSTFVPPRDAAERLVAAAWREVLGVPVGATHEFDELGGDREKAERVTSLLSARTGTELTVATLFARPTVELMADVVRASDRATGSVVRVLREDGVEPPLFFFHPGGGNTAVFRQLADLLDPAVRAYGFDRVDATATVEERVAHYLPELRRIQPAGPYRLVGWSFGGFLAFEAAQQLVAAGEEVDLLGLIDPILPLPQEPGLSEVELMRRRLARFGEFLRTGYGKKIDLPIAELVGLDDEAQADLLVETIFAAGVVDERVSGAILAHQRQSFVDARLLERYHPEPYHGRTVFYSAASPVPGGLRDQRFDRTDPARGWDAVCDDLDLVVVPGHHLSVLDPPNVEVIARHLTATLPRLAPNRP
ncbi:MAG: beta-ketoacyl synthase N-terminal-like domain-containing protein [Umezawaea sp.]